MDYERSEASMHGWSGPESDSRIEIINSQPASPAVWVRDTWFHADPFTNPQILYLVSHFNDGAGCLMSQYHGRLDHERSDLSVFVIMDVAAANTNGVDRDFYVMRTQRGRQINFSQR